MSNRLSMATNLSIESLHRSGHSNRETARLLSIDRDAVNKRVRQIRVESLAQKEPESGSDQIQNRPNAPTGSEADLDAETPLPIRRMETEPGQEAQIDFGTAAFDIGADGKKRRPWMFRIVLSCSRKAYSEVVWRQTKDNFIAAIENSFHYFGGVPKTLVSVRWGATI